MYWIIKGFLLWIKNSLFIPFKSCVQKNKEFFESLSYISLGIAGFIVSIFSFVNSCNESSLNKAKESPILEFSVIPDSLNYYLILKSDNGFMSHVATEQITMLKITRKAVNSNSYDSIRIKISDFYERNPKISGHHKGEIFKYTGNESFKKFSNFKVLL
jgi:hypothetical protein